MNSAHAREIAPLEATGTQELAMRFSELLSEDNVEYEVLFNGLEEPLAVLVPDVTTAEERQRVVSAALNPIQKPWDASDAELAHYIPTGTRSRLPYPPKFMHVLDRLVQASVDDLGVRAVNLQSEEAIPEIGDAGPHTDFPDVMENPPTTTVHGVNAWHLWNGEGRVKFGAIRDFGQLRDLSELIQQVLAAQATDADIDRVISGFRVYGQTVLPNTKLDLETFVRKVTDPGRVEVQLDTLMSLYHSRAHPEEAFTEYIGLGPGDGLFFPARPHEAKGQLPVIHKFETMLRPRYFSVTFPDCAPADEVLAERERQLGRHALHSLGYQAI